MKVIVSPMIGLLVFFGTVACSHADVVSDTKFEYAGHFGAHGLVSGPTVVYDVLDAPSVVNAAVSSGDLSATFGDDVIMTDTGILDEFSFTVFNSTTGGNTGQIVTTDINVNFFDAATFNPADLSSNTAIGGFTGSLDFSGLAGGGLDPGFFITASFTGLFPAGINLNTTDLIVTQQLDNITGGTTRVGVAFFDTQNIGGGDAANWYASATDFADGFYTFGFDANMGYNILVTIPEPATTGLFGMALLGACVVRRRRS